MDSDEKSEGSPEKKKTGRPKRTSPKPAAYNTPRARPNIPYWVMMRAAEEKILRGAYDAAGQSARDAANLLGVPPRFFRDRMAIYGVVITVPGPQPLLKYDQPSLSNMPPIPPAPKKETP